MKFEAVDLYKVSGNCVEIITEKKIDGEIDLVPMPNGTSILMFSDEKLFSRNDEARKRGIMEDTPLSKTDIARRGILDLTKVESHVAFQTKPGEEITIIRKGWGRVWHNKIRRK